MPSDGILEEVVEEIEEISGEIRIVESPESHVLSHQESLQEFLVVEIPKSEICHVGTFVE